MKRSYLFIAILSSVAILSGCSKCSTCTRDPGHGAVVQTEQFCGDEEVSAQEALGWSCK